MAAKRYQFSAFTEQLGIIASLPLLDPFLVFMKIARYLVTYGAVMPESSSAKAMDRVFVT